jgi:hypothetical protein
MDITISFYHIDNNRNGGPNAVDFVEVRPRPRPGLAALSVGGGVDAPLYRIYDPARFVARCFRQFPPSFRLMPSDLGQAMGLLPGLLMDTFSGLPHLLGKRPSSS